MDEEDSTGTWRSIGSELVRLRGGERGGAIRSANKLTTHSKALFLFFSRPPLPLFSFQHVSHLTKVVHNKAGDIQFLISDLTGDCGFLISILDP